MSPSNAWTPFAVSVLRDADRRMRVLGDDHRAIVAFESAMRCLTGMDSMYVGFYREQTSMVYAYSSDHGRSFGTDLHPFGPHGLAAWMLREKRPYRYIDDEGALLHRGVSFGDRNQVSHDAMVIPLVSRSTGAIIGVVGFLADEAHVFGDDDLAAALWLAARWMATKDDLVQSHRTPDLYAGSSSALDSSSAGNQTDVAHELNLHLEEIETKLGALIGRSAPPSAYELNRELGSARAIAQTAAVVVNSLLTVDASAPPAQSTLTRREREIAHLIAQRTLTNQEIAAELFIAETTVKAHVGKILRKLGATRREDIAVALAHTIR